MDTVLQKICKKCNEIKQLKDFAKNKTKKDGLQETCRECRRTYSKNHYQNNIEYYINKADKFRNILQVEMRKYKESHACKDCNNFFPYYVMDFDHVKGEKIDNIGTMIRHGLRKQIFIEIKKCELVCSNCHRVRTFKRQNNIPV